MKMKIEIWSDIMCPFCYIGKRKLEEALSQFEHASNIAVEWHSFQLDPEIKSGVYANVYDYLAERKGFPVEQSQQMHEQVSHAALQVGLHYDFDKAVVANSFDAHRVIQLAKQQQMDDAMEERLFKAYFTEGKDFGNHEELVQLAVEVGLRAEKVREVLSGNLFVAEVRQNIAEAQAIGVRGVPFFVFNRKVAVSGAQAVETFLQALQQSYAQWQKEQPKSVFQEMGDGAVCTTEGECG